MSDPSLAATIDRALRSAGLATDVPGGRKILSTIHKALEAAGLKPAEPADTATPARPLEWVERVDGPARGGDGATLLDRLVGRVDPARPAEPVAPAPPAPGADAPRTGSFTTHRQTGPAGEREYRLYVPAALPAGPVPLVLMLHGCRQDPDDFARGTRMNELAEREGFIVAYPAQTRRANGSNCWNWFQEADQHRGRGEPEILAEIVRTLLATQPIDPKRVFVAGLSAGASMALILGRTHPELFAGIGAHSGLPFGAAHDVGSAFAAMHNGPSGGATMPSTASVPTIVFHGDADHTVAIANADAIVAQAFVAGEARGPLTQDAAARQRRDGRDVTRTRYLDRDGRSQIELWRLHGAAHAWSGGDPAGSFTDAQGPDASAEMLRFFLER